MSEVAKVKVNQNGFEILPELLYSPSPLYHPSASPSLTSPNSGNKTLLSVICFFSYYTVTYIENTSSVPHTHA